MLIEKIKDKKIRKIYAENTIKNGWSRNVLTVQIQTVFHKRIGNSNNNFNVLLPPKDSDLVNNTIKDPYIFYFITLKEEYKEKELEFSLITKIKNVLLDDYIRELRAEVENLEKILPFDEPDKLSGLYDIMDKYYKKFRHTYLPNKKWLF